MRLDVFRSQMLDERVVARIFGYNVNVRCGVAHRQYAKIEGDVEIECIRAIARQFEIGGARSQALHCRRELERHGFLTRADENDHTHLFVVEQRQQVGMGRSRNR